MAWDPDELRAEVLGEFAEQHATGLSVPGMVEMIGRDVVREFAEAAPALEAQRLEVRDARSAGRRARRAERVATDPEWLERRRKWNRESAERRRERERRWQRMENAMQKKEDRRERLPDTRTGRTQHFTIVTKAPSKVVGGEDRVIEVDGYITTGEYADGRLGEVFVKLSHATKKGEEISPILESWSKAFSVALQMGVDVDAFCAKFIGEQHKVRGAVLGVEGVRQCTAPTDLVCQYIRARYGRKEEV